MRQFIVDGSVAGLARRLIGEEMLYQGIKFPEARRIIAREAEVSPGSLENLARNRLKRTEWIRDKLHALLIRKLEQRLSELHHELAIARAIGKIDVARAEAALAEAERALGK